MRTLATQNEHKRPSYGQRGVNQVAEAVVEITERLNREISRLQHRVTARRGYGQAGEPGLREKDFFFDAAVARVGDYCETVIGGPSRG